MTASPKVAIYARSGSDGPGRGSVAEQVARCRGHAAREGWEVAGVFEGVGVLGTARGRPGLGSLLAGASGFDVALAETPDRFGRDRDGVTAVRERLARSGCHLAAVSGDAAFLSPARP